MTLVTDVLGIPAAHAAEVAPVDVAADIPYFIHAGRLAVSTHLSTSRAAMRVATYLCALRELIRSNQAEIACDMLAAVTELPELRLGHGSRSANGRALGKVTAKRLVEAIRRFDVAQRESMSGSVHAAFNATQVRADRLSDLVACLIHQDLYDFTHEVLRHSRLSIPMYPYTFSSWCDSEVCWLRVAGRLPQLDGVAVLFVPQDCVSSSLDWTITDYLRFSANHLTRKDKARVNAAIHSPLKHRGAGASLTPKTAVTGGGKPARDRARTTLRSGPRMAYVPNEFWRRCEQCAWPIALGDETAHICQEGQPPLQAECSWCHELFAPNEFLSHLAKGCERQDRGRMARLG